jgi:3-phosphoshikimate 1-carboxyvinyltransferase
MKTFGVEVENQSYQRFIVRGNQHYRSPGDYLVEGDASSASYFLAAGAIKGGTVKVTGIGRNSVQGDIRFADVLEKMGATVTWGDDFIACTHGELNAIDMDMNHIPDAAMTIATAALFAKGTTTLRNIYNWRVKETDRLFAMATELRKVGAEVEEGRITSALLRPRSSSLLRSAPITTTVWQCASRWWRFPIRRSPSLIRNVRRKRSRTTSSSWRESVRWPE